MLVGDVGFEGLGAYTDDGLSVCLLYNNPWIE